MPKTTIVAFSVCWLLALACAIALSIGASTETPMPGDTRILTWLQEQPAPGLTLSNIARWLEATEGVLAAGCLIAIALWFAHYRTETIVLAVIMALLVLTQGGIKDLVDRPRPSHPTAELRAGFTSPSFPSGHAMSATVFYGFASYLTWPAGCQSCEIRRMSYQRFCDSNGCTSQRLGRRSLAERRARRLSVGAGPADTAVSTVEILSDRAQR